MLSRLSLASYTKVRYFFFNLQTSHIPKRPLHLKGTVRKTQAGFASGGGDSTGSTTSTGNTQDNTPADSIISSVASGNFAFTSGGSGFVDTMYGGAQASGSSKISGTSAGNIDGLASGYGQTTFSGSSNAFGDGNAIGVFSPFQSSGANRASGSGTGSLNAAGSGFIELVLPGPVVAPQPLEPYKTGYSFGSGTAKTEASGSAIAFNMLASTGGSGFGMAAGTATGVLDSLSIYGLQIDSAATGTFSGSGSGSYGNTPSLPYTSGSVNGNGGGAGKAVVNGAVTGYTLGVNDYSGSDVNTNGNAAFNTTGGGSGFVKGKNGGASGSAAGGAFGTVAGVSEDLPATDKTYGATNFGVTSAANGNGIFFGGYSTQELPGPTGGTGSGNGALNILAKTGTGIYIMMGWLPATVLLEASAVARPVRPTFLVQRVDLDPDRPQEAPSVI